MNNKLKSMLAEGPVTFSFKKLNGETRKMTATTNPSFIPENKEIIQNNSTSFRVYDLENKGYRAISVDAEIMF
jgi:hypothetical protein